MMVVCDFVWSEMLDSTILPMMLQHDFLNGGGTGTFKYILLWIGWMLVVVFCILCLVIYLMSNNIKTDIDKIYYKNGWMKWMKRNRMERNTQPLMKHQTEWNNCICNCSLVIFLSSKGNCNHKWVSWLLKYLLYCLC